MGDGQGSGDPYLYFRGYKIGIFGWRKRCLYGLLMVLLLMVIINLALTLWIMKVLDFSASGLGALRVVKGGVVLEGDSWVMGQLVTSSIRSRSQQPISLQSSRNFTVSVRDGDGRLTSQLALGPEGLQVTSDSLRVTDRQGAVLFSASPAEVVVGAAQLQVTGDGGAIFEGSLETPAVRAEPGSELKLESATRSLEISAPLGVAIEARAGDISAACLSDMKLQSTGGSVRIDSPSVVLPKLPIASPGGATEPEVYQVCACTNGKLFVTPSDGSCVADSTVCK